MRVDLEVNRRKYDVEVARLCDQGATLRGWGCLVVRTEFPQIDVMFVPRHAVQVVTHRPRPTTGRIILPGPPILEEVPQEWPACSGRAFGVRIGLDDYDQRPASLRFMDPFDWTPLPFPSCPQGCFFPVDGGDATSVVLAGYAGLDRPFLCVRGVREYHEHLQHADDEWAAIRGHFGVFRILQLVWQTCIQSTRPAFVLTPGAGGQTVWRSVKEA